MKKLITLFLCIFVYSVVHAQQWSKFTFDTGDTLSHYFVSIDTVNYHHNIWQIGKPNKTFFTAAHSAPNAIVTDTLNPYVANDTSVFILKIPFRHLVPGWGLSVPMFLQFYYQLKKDSNSIARLEVSQDSGAHWYNVKDTLPSLFSSPVSSLPHLSDTTAGWAFYNINFNWSMLFSKSISDSFLFRFTFISDTVTPGKDGWMLDDFWIEYYVEGIVQQTLNNNLITVYPNPSKGNIYIHSNDQSAKNGTVNVYNVQGQEVYKNDKLPPGAYLSLPLPDGIYTLKYSTNDEYCTKRIVIKK